LKTELDKGYGRRPFSSPPFPIYRVSPLGKATHIYSGKKRLIFDLSSPHNKPEASIDDLIAKDQCTLSYVKLDDAISIIQSWKGKSSFQFGLGSR
jgi:hypothetical protein